MTRPTLLNYVTCSFGVRGSWAAGYHTGVDYRAPVGTKIFSTKKGVVIHSGWGGLGEAYGNHVVIKSHYKGHEIRHLYAHLSKNNVPVGRKVRAGIVIGLSGVTGNVTGPHLHYEERHSPFGYWNHQRPQFVSWQPNKNKVLGKILKRIGVK